MSSLINFSIKNAGGGYSKFTMSINDQPDKYGNTCAVWIAQSKEERDSKEKKQYVGNGSVIWTDGVINKTPPRDDKGLQQAKKTLQPPVDDFDSDGIPF